MDNKEYKKLLIESLNRCWYMVLVKWVFPSVKMLIKGVKCEFIVGRREFIKSDSLDNIDKKKGVCRR